MRPRTSMRGSKLVSSKKEARAHGPDAEIVQFAEEPPAREGREKRLSEKGPVVIAWKHERLPSLAKALGMEKPRSWKADDFDSMYVLSNEGGGHRPSTTEGGRRRRARRTRRRGVSPGRGDGVPQWRAVL